MLAEQCMVLSAVPACYVWCMQVEDLLRETLKREVRKWRARRGPTSFNADVSNRLAEVAKRQ
jgi:hypothetical protein